MSIRLRHLILVPLAVAAVMLCAARPAAAAFSADTGAAMSVTSATLTPPTGTVATTSCNIFGGSTVKVTWTAPVSTYSAGYTAYLSANHGAPQAVPGSIKADATSVTIPINNLVTYTVTLRSSYGSWSSAASSPTGAFLCL